MLLLRLVANLRVREVVSDPATEVTSCSPHCSDLKFVTASVFASCLAKVQTLADTWCARSGDFGRCLGGLWGRGIGWV